MAKISLYVQAQAVLLDDVQDSVCISSEARVLALAGDYWSLSDSVLEELRWVLMFLTYPSDKPQVLSLPLGRLRQSMYQVGIGTPAELLKDAWPMRILPWLQDPELSEYTQDLLRLHQALEHWFSSVH